MHHQPRRAEQGMQPLGQGHTSATQPISVPELDNPGRLCPCRVGNLEPLLLSTITPRIFYWTFMLMRAVGEKPHTSAT